MENAKDTFYITLRDRLAALNPGRTVVVRGVIRPGILVESSELATSVTVTDTYVLRWTGVHVDAHGAASLARLQCEIGYCTDGSAGNAGMDRGRALSAMDAELVQILQPQSALKKNFAVTPAAAMGTSIFWGDAVFGAATADGERLRRVATVDVFAYQETGEA